MKFRHLLLFVSFLLTNLVLIQTLSASTELKLLDSQLLRMKDHSNPIEIINPFSRPNRVADWSISLFFSGEQNVLNFYQDISSKNQTRINQKLQNSFGVPYSFFTQVDLYKIFNIGDVKFKQGLHANLGGSFYLIDPVFPEVETLLFKNYNASTELNFLIHSDYKVNFSVNYGIMQILNQKLTVGQLVESKPSFKLSERPYNFYMNINLKSEYRLENWGRVLVEMTSLPITKVDYKIFNSFLGFETHNLFQADWSHDYTVKLYAGYSPFYQGNYLNNRTAIFGTKFRFFDVVNFDLFTNDHTYLGAHLAVGTSLYNLSVFTYQQSYDDYGIYKFRNYGFNLNYNF